MLFVLGIIFFILLIVVHEFGHMMAAKRGGVEVEEFGVGFPPRAWGKQFRKSKGDKTLYSLNWLPLGGFVKLKGEHDSAKDKGSFGAASLKTKVKILVAGVTMNFLTAWALLTILFLVGAPSLPFKDLPFYGKDQWVIKSDTKSVDSKLVVVAVGPDSPAAKAGINSGDQILSLNNVTVDQTQSLSNLTKQFAGQNASIEYISSDGARKNTTAELRAAGASGGVLGVSTATDTKLKSTWSSPINALLTSAQTIEVTARGIGYAFSNLFQGNGRQAGEVVGGPVATVNAIRVVSEGGLTQLIMLIALISLSLAIMNILPIPALDGGRLFLILLFRLRGKELTKDKEENINAWGMGILLLFIVGITVLDVTKLIR